MWRSTMSDGLTLASPNLDEASRAAAISAMASRLAAAGPRTRQRLRTGGARPANDNRVKYAWREAGVTREDSWAAPSSREPTRPWQISAWRSHLSAARTGAIITAMGLGGFGAVLLALHPHSAGQPHAQAMAAGTPPPAPLAAQQAQPQAAPKPHPPRAQPSEFARLSHPAAHKAVVAAASYTTPAHHAAPHAEPVLLADPRPPVQNHADDTPYELPRWLQQQDAPKPPLIMSEPPHNLTLPPSYGNAAPPPAPRPMPPPYHPPLIFAWSGYNQAPYPMPPSPDP